jgi:hypothetical protein
MRWDDDHEWQVGNNFERGSHDHLKVIFSSCLILLHLQTLLTMGRYAKNLEGGSCNLFHGRIIAFITVSEDEHQKPVATAG